MRSKGKAPRSYELHSMPVAAERCKRYKIGSA
jgi:hypothetical protein